MRSEQQIADERQTLTLASTVLDPRPDNPSYWLNLGAWLALHWALESDGEYPPDSPLLNRLRHAVGHGVPPDSGPLTVNDAPNLPQSKSRNPPFEKQAK